MWCNIRILPTVKFRKVGDRDLVYFYAGDVDFPSAKRFLYSLDVTGFSQNSQLLEFEKWTKIEAGSIAPETSPCSYVSLSWARSKDLFGNFI